jgi:small subunit ribosomal protein S9
MSQPGPDTAFATGRRKTSVASVKLVPGDGRIVVNRRPAEEYFARETLCQVIQQPFEAANQVGRFHVTVSVSGGGIAGQAGATRHAIARALERFDPSLRATLKRAGFFTRDAREKERKKYGQRGARARFQFSKR